MALFFYFKIYDHWLSKCMFTVKSKTSLRCVFKLLYVYFDAFLNHLVDAVMWLILHYFIMYVKNGLSVIYNSMYLSLRLINLSLDDCY